MGKGTNLQAMKMQPTPPKPPTDMKAQQMWQIINNANEKLYSAACIHTYKCIYTYVCRRTQTKQSAELSCLAKN